MVPDKVRKIAPAEDFLWMQANMGERPGKWCRTPAAPSRHRVEGSREAAVPARGEKSRQQDAKCAWGVGEGRQSIPCWGNKALPKEKRVGWRRRRLICKSVEKGGETQKTFKLSGFGLPFGTKACLQEQMNCK